LFHGLSKTTLKTHTGVKAISLSCKQALLLLLLMMMMMMMMVVVVFKAGNTPTSKNDINPDGPVGIE